MLTINMDLDGVIYPWHEVTAEWVKMITNPNSKKMYDWDSGKQAMPVPDKWDLEKTWGLTDAEFKAMFESGVKSGYIWRTGEPREGAQAMMWALDGAGFYIRIVTKRLVHKTNHALVQQVTSEWLDYWNIPYHEIVYVGNQSSKGEFSCDMAVDDYEKHITQYEEAGCAMPLLVRRPWNADSEFHQQTGYTVDKLSEVATLGSLFAANMEADVQA